VTLAAGSILGPYEIVALLGAGGMGEVYRARDTRLDRTVALKILPSSLASDPAFRERFTREGRAISQLDHPHICTLYDVGEQDGTSFLVMQYLAGETLENRLKKGPVPLDQSLEFAMQIADALDKAHRAGIVHRDLKPGNIMLTTSGAMLLDFGLAKTAGLGAAAGLSMLPTTPPGLTAKGTILGTFQYMAPEQLEGHEVDARTDIFAFGSVLYEMLTGRKTFEGQSQASLIAAILEREPRPISAWQPLSPPALDAVVQGCLAKAPDDRWQTAHDVKKQLQWLATSGSPASVATTPSRRRVPWAWVPAGAGISLLVGAVGTALYPRRAEEPPPSRFLITTPELYTPASLSVSPDGRRIVFSARTASGGTYALFLRSLDNVEAQPLAGTENAGLPFWSPDSRSIGFASQGKLKRMDVSGGPPQDICDVQGFGGATWNADGIIVFSSGPGALRRVSASGGQPVDATTLDPAQQEQAHVVPFFLPDGRHFLFWAVGRENTIDSASLDEKEHHVILKGATNSAYTAPGYLLFHRSGTLMAQRFDPDRLRLSGEPVRVADGLLVNPLLFADFAVSNTGVLLYRTAGGRALSQLVWYDRAGKSLGPVGAPGEYRGIALSPDGTRIAVHQHREPGGGDIWLLDQRGTITRFTFNAFHNMEPVWTRDGQTIMFSAGRAGEVLNLYRKSASGLGNDELLLRDEYTKYASDWAPDGRSILYGYFVRGQIDISVLPLTGERKPKPLLNSDFVEANAKLSPDGRWIAYASNEAVGGQFEVYVQPYPERTGKWQISDQGGAYPRWSRDGKELFYLTADGTLTVVAVDTKGPAFSAGTPRALFPTRALLEDHTEGSSHYTYDVSQDGKRFIVNERVAPSNQTIPLTLVLNWPAVLKK
jgi:serine/threonine protein kinase/Tol biopolymer transport system component